MTDEELQAVSMDKYKIHSFLTNLFATSCGMVVLLMFGIDVNMTTFFAGFFGTCLFGFMFDMVKK